MLGAIIGDIAGSAWEFNPTNYYHFPMFTEKNSYTDDTICTVAIADALLHGSEDYGSYLRMWCSKYPHPKGGYGGNFRRWLFTNPSPYNSFGNGSAMRVSPVNWVYTDMADVLYQARKTAECTHNHPEGIKGAQAVAFAMQAVSEGVDFSRRKFTFQSRIEGAVELFHYDRQFRKSLPQTRNIFDETCQGTVPVALRIIYESDSFEDAIRKAVTHGADADTLAAIVGSIAERIWGIPEWMKMKAMRYLPVEMKTVISRFRDYVQKIRKLSAQCRYFKYGETFDNAVMKLPYDIEKRWVFDLARSYKNADDAKYNLRHLNNFENWQAIADQYHVPLSFLWYVIDTVAPDKITTCVCKSRLVAFLDKYYI